MDTDFFAEWLKFYKIHCGVGCTVWIQVSHWNVDFKGDYVVCDSYHNKAVTLKVKEGKEMWMSGKRLRYVSSNRVLTQLKTENSFRGDFQAHWKKEENHLTYRHMSITDMARA